MSSITNRDREYLRVIYSIHGNRHNIGPVKLAETMGISKVCAFQKMHRLQALGYGNYEPHKGLKLNKKALNIVKNDMERHHIIEAYLSKYLGLSHYQACNEAEYLSETMSIYLFQKISQHIINEHLQCCNYVSSQTLTPEIMKSCPWIKKSIKR